MKPLTPEQKYRLYENSVQNCSDDIEFINEEFKRLRKRPPLVLEEDFSGTSQLSCLWACQSSQHRSFAIDLDPEPLRYGKKHHYDPLEPQQQKRITFFQKNVFDKQNFRVDVATAFNFSYFIIKKRKELLKYFKRIRSNLADDGIFFVDLFGGKECRQPLEEETEHENHSYYWDCDFYNPLRNEVEYHIHFKTDKKKYSKVFSYDWRMWTPMEIIELMEEAGFSQVLTWWEGEGDDGEGNGIFNVSSREEQCDSWIVYVGGLA